MSCDRKTHGKTPFCIEHHRAGCPALQRWVGGSDVECTCAAGDKKKSKECQHAQ